MKKINIYTRHYKDKENYICENIVIAPSKNVLSHLINPSFKIHHIVEDYIDKQVKIFFTKYNLKYQDYNINIDKKNKKIIKKVIGTGDIKNIHYNIKTKIILYDIIQPTCINCQYFNEKKEYCNYYKKILTIRKKTCVNFLEK